MNIWIGRNFRTTGILIVLESTYADDESWDTYLPKWVAGTLTRGDNTITRMFNDCSAKGQKKEDFWDSVALYNFVPGSVGPTNAHKAGGKHFAQGASVFQKVFDQVQPAGVFLVGKSHRPQSKPIVAANNIPCVTVDHPRSGVSHVEMRKAWNALRVQVGLPVV